MNDKELKELQKYNLEYLEARNSEEIFGGDYTSAVELKYAKKEIERLNNIIKEVQMFAEEYKKEWVEYDEVQKDMDKLLEILNKGDNKE